MSTIPKIIADFETQLATAIAAGGTTFSIASILDDDGVTIPDGTYCLTVDNGSSNKEYLMGVMVAGTLTSVQSVSRQGVATTGAVRAHRVGASVILTDFIAIAQLASILAGTTQLSAASPLGYDGAPASLTGNQLATVAYVLSVVTGGTVTFDQQVVAGQIAGETLAVNDHVYFKQSDQKWWKVSAGTTSTFADARRGFSKTATTAGGTIVVAISGPVSGFSGLTAGSKYYASNTSGAISTTAGNYQVFAGWALSTTQMLLSTTTHSDSFIGGIAGEIKAYGGLAAPTGYLACDGSLISIASYIPLVSVIQGLWGLGTGTTFTATVLGSILTATSHGLAAGAPLQLASTSVLPAGLSANTIYYVINPTTNTFQVSATLGGSAIAFSDTGSGTHSYYTQVKTPDFRSRTIVGTGTGTKVATFVSRSSNVVTVKGITNAANNEFQTGQPVLYSAPSGAMTGLTDNTTYYLIRTGNLTFSLATNLANAQNGTAISLSSDGTGTQTFTLTLTTRTVADFGGEETHAMSSSELLAHTHTFGTGSAGGPTGPNTVGSTQFSANTSSAGGNAAMNNMQPFAVALYIIKT